jgi:hypothetical protein
MNDRCTPSRRERVYGGKARAKKRSDQEILPLGKREERGQMLTSVWAAAGKARANVPKKELDYPRCS